MEALSPTMEEGQLVRWLKAEGDSVSEGDILAEIETDKATMELVARGSGVLRKIGLQEGGTAKVGDVIAVIAKKDEDIGGIVAEPGNGGPAARAPAKKAEEKAGDVEEEAEPEEEEEAEEQAPAPSKRQPRAEREEKAAKATTKPKREAEPAEAPDGDGRVKASPLAKRMASDAGIALDRVKGSGPGGRIIRRDIEAAAKSPAPAAAAARRAPGGPEIEEVPVSQMRKTIAKRLVTSIGPVPTFYLTIDVDMSRLLAAREQVNARLEAMDGGKASINDFLIKALAMALARHPEVNAQWQDTVIVRHHRVHVGVAVAVDEGLITPIVRDADAKGVAEIAREVRELAGRAREKKLKPDEYTGATFSISNLGMFGIEEFTAIINPPEAGIIAVGEVREKVVVENGEMVIRPRMRMTMSCDHRVVDGATGARFLQTVRAFVEEPVMMLV
jgi:pyruvate dehydrogenase E2 component (dihydrolipoamide acetyltransferase)